MTSLNVTQKAAYELIQSDARFLYTLTVIQREAKNINTNYLLMCQPYIGLFADGAEQWSKKVGLSAPSFNEVEKKYYTDLRQSHKLYEASYSYVTEKLAEKLKESDDYFYSIRNIRERILGYYNVGADLCNGEFCGNTILCALYTPVCIWNNNEIGPWLRNISAIVGKLAAYFGCLDCEPYIYNKNQSAKYRDFHFYRQCPIEEKSDLGFLLFSILCSINFALEFIDGLFIEEAPFKFKFAYLQYYYLCDFVKAINSANGTELYLNDSLKNRDFRNCLAHYGLGQYLTEDNIFSSDPLKGLTVKAFGIDYFETKEKLYTYLAGLISQIKKAIRITRAV